MRGATRHAGRGNRRQRGKRIGIIQMRNGARQIAEIAPVEQAGLDGDMLEAQAFAYLAVRVFRGMVTSCPGTTGVATGVGGGQVSQPGKRGAEDTG